MWGIRLSVYEERTILNLLNGKPLTDREKKRCERLKGVLTKVVPVREEWMNASKGV